MQVPISIVVADTSLIVRKGIKAILEENPQFTYLGAAEDWDELLKLLKTQKPDVLLIDHCCNECFSLEKIKYLTKNYSKLNLLVISQEKSLVEIRSILSMGIQNYLLKDCTEKEITEAIQACAKGEKYFCPQIIDVLMESEILTGNTAITYKLTTREIEIIKLLVSGMRTKLIADLLHISPLTLNTHKKNIYKKLGIGHSYELARFALRKGLMS